MNYNKTQQAKILGIAKRTYTDYKKRGFPMRKIFDRFIEYVLYEENLRKFKNWYYELKKELNEDEMDNLWELLMGDK